MSVLDDLQPRQAIADFQLFVFSDDSANFPASVPHSGENRVADMRLAFPRTPQPNATPIYRVYPRTLIDKSLTSTYTIESLPNGNYELHVRIESGTPDSHGLYYADIALTFDESIADLCDPTACSHPPGYSCQFSGEYRFAWIPGFVPLAQEGDVVISPSDGNGLIGGLMKRMDPVQYYDHCGIFTSDSGMVIRHATSAADRTNQKRYYNGSVLGTPIPQYGVREDVVRYGWPGTITQTVDEVYFSGRNTLNPEFSFFTLHPAATPVLQRELDFEERARLGKFNDPEDPDSGYALQRLGDAPIVRDDAKDPVAPRLVRPHPSREARVRPYLKRIAEEARHFRGHYRFFAYSNGEIAFLPAGQAPPAGDPAWAGLPKGADWSTITWPTRRRSGKPTHRQTGRSRRRALGKSPTARWMSGRAGPRWPLRTSCSARRWTPRPAS